MGMSLDPGNCTPPKRNHGRGFNVTAYAAARPGNLTRTPPTDQVVQKDAA